LFIFFFIFFFLFFPELERHLCESRSVPDSKTHVVHLRKGDHWQDVGHRPNGRENSQPTSGLSIMTVSTDWAAVSIDPVLTVRRMCGYRISHRSRRRDKYTVVFKFKTLNPDLIMEALHNISQAQCGLRTPDASGCGAMCGTGTMAVGTGPFMLQNFVSGSFGDAGQESELLGNRRAAPGE